VNSLDWGGAATITPNEESVKEVKITPIPTTQNTARNSGAHSEVFLRTAQTSTRKLFLKWIGRGSIPSKATTAEPVGCESTR